MFKTHGFITESEKVRGEKGGFLADSSSFLPLTSKDFYAGLIGNKYQYAGRNIYNIPILCRYGDIIYVEAKGMGNWRRYGNNDTKSCLSVDGHRERRHPSHRDCGGIEKIVNGVDKK